MFRIGFLLITLINLVGLAVLSIFAAAPGGNGVANSQVGWTVLTVGGLWVFSFTLVSWKLHTRGKTDEGLLIALITWPVAIFLNLVWSWSGSKISNFKPNLPEFELACKSTGPKYENKPITPAHSIAYDWEGENYPSLNIIRTSSSGRIESIQYSKPIYGSTIEFTESRCCTRTSRPANNIGPYIRMPSSNTGQYFGVSEISSDILVEYKLSKIDTLNKDNKLNQVDITITDRRDKKNIASLRHVSDELNKKLCGTTSEGLMDETAFIKKALGLN